jgi:hypothetical protein
MRFLKESLLLLFVLGVVVSLYFLAASAALFGLCGFVSHRDEPDTLDHAAIATNEKSYRSAAMSYNHPANL